MLQRLAGFLDALWHILLFGLFIGPAVAVGMGPRGEGLTFFERYLRFPLTSAGVLLVAVILVGLMCGLIRRHLVMNHR
jgi:hypothetical protein